MVAKLSTFDFLSVKGKIGKGIPVAGRGGP
jgi:hypothetical protein